MKGMTAFACISDIDLELIEESMSLFAAPKAVAKEPSRLSRFLNSGWGVAMICTLVSVAVLSAMVWAGRQQPVKPPAPGTVESDRVTAPESMPDVEQETEGGADTEAATEAVTEGVLHPDVTEGGVLFISNGDGTCKVKGADKTWEGVIIVPERSPYGDVVTTVVAGGFKDFSGITSVTLPDTVTVIKKCAFQNCGALQHIDLPAEVTEFGSALFDRCGELESVVLPKGLAEIPAMTFQTCVSLQSVVAQEGVTSIGANAFNGARSLETLTLPAGLRSIGSAAFMNCCGLRTIYYGGDRAEWKAVEVHSYENAHLGHADVVFAHN